MEDEIDYSTICEVCDSEIEITIYGTSDRPVFCPVCGEQTEWDQD